MPGWPTPALPDMEASARPSVVPLPLEGMGVLSGNVGKTGGAMVGRGVRVGWSGRAVHVTAGGGHADGSVGCLGTRVEYEPPVGRVGVGVLVGRGGVQVPVGVGVPVGTVYWREPYGKQLQPHAVAVAIAACSVMNPSAHPAGTIIKIDRPVSRGQIAIKRVGGESGRLHLVSRERIPRPLVRAVSLTPAYSALEAGVSNLSCDIGLFSSTLALVAPVAPGTMPMVRW